MLLLLLWDEAGLLLEDVQVQCRVVLLVDVEVRERDAALGDRLLWLHHLLLLV